MGVPTFYRWLVTRYPKIVKSVYESRDGDIYLRRTKTDENGDFFKVHDLGDYVNNTDEAHCSDNINGYFDNLYLDMNGIIHLCSHSDNSKRAKSNEEIFLNVFLYVERLFDVIEPKKLLYMAIDGVAPKAKMNQQRSRRFKSILCSEIERKAYIELKEKFIAENKMVPEESSYWDSNVITPGTPFMHELSIALKYFIEHKITNDEKWKKIVVIFSDSNVCGEGEHKIFNFIKSQRAQEGYDPNTRHVIHGMDADLIMLSLASHEPYFYILREIIDLDPKGEEKEKKKEYIGMLKSKEDAYFCSQFTNPTKKLLNKYNDPNYANVNINKTSSLNYQYWNELQLLDLTILREYLSKDLFFDSTFNMERCIDDFIFICFFCGNDFLPHLPSISIAGGSIDQLILLYQKVLPTLGDYLINEGTINLKPFFKYVSFIAEIERETFISQYDFKKKREKRELQKDSLKRAKCIEEEQNQGSISNRTNINSDANSCANTKNDSTYSKEYNSEQNSLEQPSTGNIISKKMLYESKIQSMQPIRNIKYKDKKGEKSINFLVRPPSNITEQIVNEQTANSSVSEAQKNNKVENKIVETSNSTNIYHKHNQKENNNEHNDKTTIIFNSTENNKKAGNMDNDENKKLNDINEFNLLLKEAIKKANESENPKDDVELGCDENPEVTRIKYYKSKFHLDETDYIDEFVKNVVYKYIEGLAWVLAYYFQSCPMWHWYYPYYYAPLSSDLIIDDISFHFEKDEPLLPFEQLLCVLPSNSSHCLPKVYRNLMLHHESPIIDFYPKTFKEEENGKKYKYQWVILLPFVDKDRIIKHARPLHDLLTSEEKKRNRRGLNKIYVDSTHPLSKQITKSIKKYLKKSKEKENLEEKEEIKGVKNSIVSEEVDKKKKKMKNSTYDDFFKNMNITVPINTKKDINIFGYLNCKHEESDVNILKEIFRFSSNFSTTCNSAFYIEPEFKKHTSSLLPNHINPKKVLNILDINNEERKLRFNAPAAKRMILNSLSNNHPQIYSYSKYNSKSVVINYKYYNSNNYSNDHKKNNTQNYNNYNKHKEHMYNNYHNINSNSYMNTQKNYPHQNYQNIKYNENLPSLSHKNPGSYKIPKNNPTYVYDNKKDNNYHNYMNQKSSYNKDNSGNYESPYKISYNNHNNNYIRSKNEKPFSNNHHNSTVNYHNNYKSYNNENTNFRGDTYKSSKSSIGMNKRTTYDSRSVPYKNKEY